MSAFLVSNNHISIMIETAIGLELRLEDIITYQTKESFVMVVREPEISLIAKTLLSENIKSLDYRYPDDKDDKTRGLILESYVYHETKKDYSIMDIFHFINCYEYQSCEHDGWEKSWSNYFCLKLRHALIMKMPEYQDCQSWEA